MLILHRCTVFVSCLLHTFVLGFVTEAPYKQISAFGYRKSLPASRSAVSENELTLHNVAVRRDNEIFEDIYASITQSMKGEAVSTVYLANSHDGLRGVYLNQDMNEGQIILSVPLSFCIRDDKLPLWASTHFPVYEPRPGDGDDHVTSKWVVRVATSLIDLQLRAIASDDISKLHRMWLDLLPNPSFLRASLPVHWSDDLLSKVQCTAFEMAVDSSYFFRAQAVQDLIEILQDFPLALSLGPEARRDLINNALDLVQTRTCKVIASNGEPLRLLAPLFDLINHDSNKANAEYYLDEADGPEQSLCLVVRALRDIQAGSEVFISYGESANPDWRCLNSYGFVPVFEPGMAVLDGEHTAEIFLEGQRFLVSPDSVSEDLVSAMAFAMGEVHESKVALTPNIALRLAQRIAEAAFQILLSDGGGISASDEASDDGMTDKGSESAELVISERLAAEFRWNQHRILMSCSLGLRDWAKKTKL